MGSYLAQLTEEELTSKVSDLNLDELLMVIKVL